MKPALVVTAMWLMSAMLLAAPGGPYLGDYDAELRRPDGHVDCELLIQRLKDMGANTYMWLLWHRASDWEDLHEFLPLAQEAGISAWVYLVPHSESGTHGEHKWPYSEPFRLDYIRWAREIALLSIFYDNLVGYVIDDFWGNFGRADRFSVEYTRKMVETGKAFNPELKFYPLMYYRQFGLEFVEKLAPLIDGTVAAYPKDREEIEKALTFLNDEYTVPASVQIAYPPNTPSKAGDHGFITQKATVKDAAHASVTFHYSDTYNGPTHGYHFMQLLVDGDVVWEEDGGGRDDAEVTVDISRAAAGKDHIQLTFGVYDKQAVGQYPLTATFSGLRTEGIELTDSDPGKADAWKVDAMGAFEVRCNPTVEGGGKFRLPLIVMPSGSRGEYKDRYGDEGTAERIAAFVRMTLEMVAEGKVEGVVMYCLDKGPGSEDLEAVGAAYKQFRATQQEK